MDIGLLQANLAGILQVLEKVCSLVPILRNTSTTGMPLYLARARIGNMAGQSVCSGQGATLDLRTQKLK